MTEIVEIERSRMSQMSGPDRELSEQGASLRVGPRR